VSHNEGLLNTISEQAGADLSGKQFYGVALVTAAANPPGVLAMVGVAAKAICGVLQNNPLNGQAATIQTSGITKVAISPNQAITGGTTLLDLDTGGTFIPHATGTIVAQALDSLPSTAAIGIISARLMPSNSPTA
jgi:hypothetical protein